MPNEESQYGTTELCANIQRMMDDPEFQLVEIVSSEALNNRGLLSERIEQLKQKNELTIRPIFYVFEYRDSNDPKENPRRIAMFLPTKDDDRSDSGKLHNALPLSLALTVYQQAVKKNQITKCDFLSIPTGTTKRRRRHWLDLFIDTSAAEPTQHTAYLRDPKVGYVGRFYPLSYIRNSVRETLGQLTFKTTFIGQQKTMNFVDCGAFYLRNSMQAIYGAFKNKINDYSKTPTVSFEEHAEFQHFIERAKSNPLIDNHRSTEFYIINRGAEPKTQEDVASGSGSHHQQIKLIEVQNEPETITSHVYAQLPPKEQKQNESSNKWLAIKRTLSGIWRVFQTRRQEKSEREPEAESNKIADDFEDLGNKQAKEKNIATKESVREGKGKELSNNNDETDDQAKKIDDGNDGLEELQQILARSIEEGSDQLHPNIYYGLIVPLTTPGLYLKINSWDQSGVKFLAEKLASCVGLKNTGVLYEYRSSQPLLECDRYSIIHQNSFKDDFSALQVISVEHLLEIKDFPKGPDQKKLIAPHRLQISPDIAMGRLQYEILKKELDGAIEQYEREATAIVNTRDEDRDVAIKQLKKIKEYCNRLIRRAETRQAIYQSYKILRGGILYWRDHILSHHQQGDAVVSFFKLHLDRRSHLAEHLNSALYSSTLHPGYKKNDEASIKIYKNAFGEWMKEKIKTNASISVNKHFKSGFFNYFDETKSTVSTVEEKSPSNSDQSNSQVATSVEETSSNTEVGTSVEGTSQSNSKQATAEDSDNALLKREIVTIIEEAYVSEAGVSLRSLEF